MTHPPHTEDTPSPDQIARVWLGDLYSALDDGRSLGELQAFEALLAEAPDGREHAALVARGGVIATVMPPLWEYRTTFQALRMAGLQLPALAEIQGHWQALGSRLMAMSSAWKRALAEAPAELREAVLDHPDIQPLRPQLDFQLRDVATADDPRGRLRPAGPDLWHGMVTAIDSSFSITLEGRELGAGEADAMARAHPQEATRRTLSEAREAHRVQWRDLWAQAIDARAVWLTLESPEEGLRTALLNSRVSVETWEAINGALLGEALGLADRAHALRETLTGMDVRQPWNRLVPFPSERTTPLPLEEALDTITQAFSVLGPELCATVHQARDKGWIEHGARPRKRTGAFMIPFARRIEPRLLITWGGTELDALILAHELGHAHHLLAMKGLPFGRLVFPVAMSEMVSIFAEYLYRRNAHSADAQRYALSQFDRYLVYIPAMVRFEQRVLRERQGRPWTAQRLTALWLEVHEQAGCRAHPHGWCSWEQLSPTVLMRMGQVLGALVSILFADAFERDQQGFPAQLQGFLRDTGTLDMDELLQVHFGLDGRAPATWHRALQLFGQSLAS